MKIMSLSKEESVFAEQLFEIRRQQAILEIEDRTHCDRFATIMRGKGAQRAYSTDGTYVVDRGFVDGQVIIVVTKKEKGINGT